MNDFEQYKKYLKMKRKNTKPITQMTQKPNIISNNQGYSTLQSFNNQQPKNYAKMLQREKQKQKYKEYMRKKRTQQLTNVYNTTKYGITTTKQATTNFLSKAKQLYNKRKRVGYKEQL